MEAAGIVALLTTIGAIILALLKLYTGPSAKERQMRKRKEAIDEAFRKGDNETLAYLLSEHFGELRRKDKDNPGQPTDNKLSND